MKFRLTVDVLENGTPIMNGVEVAPHEWDSPVRIAAWLPGPFDTPEECFASCRAWVLDNYGEAMRLFD